MKKLSEILYLLAIVVWVGGMLAVGYLAAPVLFAELSDRILAGNLAGKMFTWVARMGLGCGAYILLFVLVRRGWSAFRSSVFWITLAMLGLVAAGHFGVQPIMQHLKESALPAEVMQSALRDRFATWHGISSVVYLVQSVLGLMLVLQGTDVRGQGTVKSRGAR
ncbi:MAG: DUF4149 domain-containing protein [Rhodocyclaceae bacterium]|nr:DUF4149 domain-containing protein [Rhodocyclaceae bacterium]